VCFNLILFTLIIIFHFFFLHFLIGFFVFHNIFCLFLLLQISLELIKFYLDFLFYFSSLVSYLPLIFISLFTSSLFQLFSPRFHLLD